MHSANYLVARVFIVKNRSKQATHPSPDTLPKELRKYRQVPMVSHEKLKNNDTLVHIFAKLFATALQLLTGVSQVSYTFAASSIWYAYIAGSIERS